MKQKIKSFISLKATSAMFGLLFFVALAGGVVIDAPSASAAEPTLTSAIFADDALKVGETSLVTFTFLEAISGFTNDDLTIANGTLTAVTDAGAGTIWTATFTPTDDFEEATNVITVNVAGVIDVATSTPGVGSTDSSNYAIDTKEPTVVLTYAADPAKAGEIIITATYSEEIVETPAISIDQQGASDITAQAMSGGATVWTYAYMIIADNGDTYVDGVATVSLSSVADSAGNNVEAPTNTTFTIDTTAPVAVSAVYKDTDNPEDGIIDEIIVTYSEDIGSSIFIDGEWSFPDNPHSLNIDSVTFLATNVHIAISSSDPDDDLTAINDTIVKYTVIGTTDIVGGVIDGAGNYAEESVELPVNVEEDDGDDEDEDDIPDGGTPKQKQPNPNSGVTLYRMEGSPRVYVIKNKKRHWVQTPKEFNDAGYNWGKVKVVSAETLEEYPDDGETSTTELLRAVGSHKVYKINNGKKRWVETAGEFNAAGYKWKDIKDVSPEVLASYQNEVSSGLLRATGSNKVYEIDNGKRRWIKTAGEFNAAGHRWGDVEDVSVAILDSYPNLNE